MSSKHVGYPVPTEMWNSMEKEEVDFLKHEAITRLLDLDLECPHCNKILVKQMSEENKTEKSKGQWHGGKGSVQKPTDQDKYADNWDLIWGKKKKDKNENN